MHPCKMTEVGAPGLFVEQGMLLLVGLHHPTVWDKPISLLTPMGTSMVPSQGWEGVALTSKPALHLRKAVVYGLRVPSGMV